MMINVNLIKLFKFVGNNKCCAMGNWFPEDDWSIVVYAETMEELERLVAKAIISSKISIDDWHLDEEKIIEYNNKKYIMLEEEEDENLLRVSSDSYIKYSGEEIENKEFYNKVKELEYFKQLEKQENDKEEALRIKEQKEKKAEKKKEECKLYKKLKKKYDKPS